MSNVVPSDYGQAIKTERAQAQTPDLQQATPTPAEPFIGQIQPQDIMSPSERPDEPVTAGLPSGPGAGPEAVRMPQPPPLEDESDMLIDHVMALEHLIAGSGDNVSAQTRIMTRQLRARIKPERFLGQ